MSIYQNKITIIYAKEGMMLTNGDVYAKAVALGVKDSPDNWQEIPEQDYISTLCLSDEI